jgi:hypothetical protein
MSTEIQVSSEISTEIQRETESDRKVRSLIERYRSLLKTSGGSIIEQAETIYDVERNLSEWLRDEFYQQVSLDPEGATVRKLKVIGSKSARFKPFLDRIPNTWTTLYDLAKLSSEDFQKVTDAELLTPFVTAKDIREFVRGKTPGDGERRRRTKVTIDLTEAEDGKALYAEIARLSRQHGAEFIVDTETKKAFAARSGDSK